MYFKTLEYVCNDFGVAEKEGNAIGYVNEKEWEVVLSDGVLQYTIFWFEYNLKTDRIEAFVNMDKRIGVSWGASIDWEKAIVTVYDKRVHGVYEVAC